MSKLIGRAVDDQTKIVGSNTIAGSFICCWIFLIWSDASNDNMTEENLRSSKIEHFL